MALRTPDTSVGPYREGTTVLITASVQDTAGVAIPVGSLAAATWSLYSENTQAYINGRDHVDLTPSIDVNGLMELELTPEDMAIVDGKLTENHRILLEWTYAGTKKGKYEIRVIVSNLAKVGT